MRILFVLSRVPYPLEKGDKLRAFHMIRELSKQHEIHLFCIAEERTDAIAQEKLKAYCKEVYVYRISRFKKWVGLLRSLFSGKPFQVEYFYAASAQKKLDELIDTHLPQHIICQLVRTTEYVKKYRVLSKTLDYMDAFSAGMQRMADRAPFPLSWVMQHECDKLRKYELSVADDFNHHMIISDQDKSAINIKQELHVIPNGVAPQFFEPRDIRKSRDVLFTGNMSYRPNVESARFLVKEVMPIVWEQLPNTRLCLAGATPSTVVQQLANERVEVTGWVEDIVAVYNSSKVFVAPMLVNSGLQNKLLEAMACQLPCVTTELANNALGAQPGTEVLIGNDASTIAEAIVDLLNSVEKREKLGVTGHAFIQRTYSWEHEAQHIEQIISVEG